MMPSHSTPRTGHVSTREVPVQPLIINGQPIEGARPEDEEQVQTIFSPKDQATIVGKCALLQESQVPAVLSSAVQGFERARRMTVPERMAVLQTMATRIQLESDLWAQRLSAEAGKPITLARQEVGRAIGVLQAYARALETFAPERRFLDGRHVEIHRAPVGPVLAITPFNFPLNLVLHKLAPAIAAGCSFTLKPAPETPLTALALGQLASECGYESISVVPCRLAQAQQLVLAEEFRKLSFTGSATVGWHLKSLVPKKQVDLELGGTGAVIVDSLDQPASAVAQRIAYAAYAYAGQVCIAVQRIFVNRTLAEDFVPELVEAIRALKVGDPADPKVVVGPLIRPRDMQRVRDLIKDAINQGANALYGGNAFNAYTMNPILLDRTTPGMRVNQEEAFGPLATLILYDELDEALSQVNNTPYGLQAGIYTTDPQAARRAFERLEMGGVIINDVPTYRHDVLPYGGVKESGTGREGVMAGLTAMTVSKLYVELPR
ncbi:MAG: aldehyde dehydrogenase family protein [Candidatus Melainabacteria bacterium]